MQSEVLLTPLTHVRMCALVVPRHFVGLRLRLCYRQYLMTGLKMHPLQTLEFMAPAATVTLLVGSYLTEYADMKRAGAFGIMRENWVPFALVASLGLTVNILGTLIVKLSSGTMLKASAACVHAHGA